MEARCSHHDDLREDIKKNCTTIKNKVGYTLFFWVMVGAFAFTGGAYTYTFNMAVAQKKDLETHATRAELQCADVRNRIHALDRTAASGDAFIRQSLRNIEAGIERINRQQERILDTLNKHENRITVIEDRSGR